MADMSSVYIYSMKANAIEAAEYGYHHPQTSHPVLETRRATRAHKKWGLAITRQ